jgi:hypothetical protein
MRKNLYVPGKKLIPILVVILLSLAHYSPVAGQDCTMKDVPYMWEKKEVGLERRNWFLAHKYKQFCEAIGGKSDAKCIFYKATDFINMINYFNELGAKYLRVYLASYDEEGSNSWVPKNFGQLMTLIFVPADKDKTDLVDHFYTISPYEPFDRVNSRLPSVIKSNWIRNYETIKLPSLRGTITLNDADNRVPRSTERSDTKSILYDFEFITQLKEEMECQPATGILAEFASYTTKGRLKEDCTIGYKRRLLIQWELTEKVGDRDQILFIEDKPGFEHRDNPYGNPCESLKNKNLPKGTIKLLQRILTFNNGQLCPPNCFE